MSRVPRRVATASGDDARVAELEREGSVRVFYLLARFVLRPLFILTCRPTVVGKDRVPLTGPVLLASNHLSLDRKSVV